jgi:Protein of unknown function (DUF2909)
MIAKTLLLLALAAVIVSLASALYYLVRDTGASQRAVRALTWRTLLSIALFLLLLLAFHFGFLHPHAAGFHAPTAAHHQ